MIIVCPVCGNILAKANDNDSTKHSILCRNCFKYIHYIPSNGYREVTKKPERKSISGLTIL